MKVLLINPYIYDVSAYGFWSAPLGLLYMGSIMRRNGAEVQLLDCLEIDGTKEKADGRAPFIKRKVKNPRVVNGVGKQFRRYGLGPEEVSERLKAVEDADLIMITCIMTYWYGGAREVADLARAAFPKAKIVLGGNYASLCYEHAVREMRAVDLVVRNFEADVFYAYLEEVCGFSVAARIDPMRLIDLPFPCFDLYEKCRFVPLLTSVGCAYRCSYCATGYLQPKMLRREVRDVVREIRHWHEWGIDRFVLYDDSFLHNKEVHAKPLLRAVEALPYGLSWYNPNALNAVMIDGETAQLLRRAGFREVRLGFETSEPQRQLKTGGKVRTEDLETAVEHLVNSGFGCHEIVVYVLTGLPGQRYEEASKTVDYLAGLGVGIHLAQFSPIPHTRLYSENRGKARYSLDDPLFQNNALFPYEWEGFTEDNLNALKKEVREHNSQLEGERF